MNEDQVEQRLAVIKQQASAARANQAKAQHGFEVADVQARQAAGELRDKYGLTSVEQVQARIAELAEVQEREMAAVESALSGTEATSG